MDACVCRRFHGEQSWEPSLVFTEGISPPHLPAQHGFEEIQIRFFMSLEEWGTETSVKIQISAYID